MKLTDINIKKAKPGEKARKMFDGGGLYIQIEPTGGKLWRYRYRFEKKEKTLYLGRYPDVSLQEARERHQEARKQLARGIDPAVAKQAHKAAGAERTANSFEVIAREWLENWKENKAKTSVRLIICGLENDCFPFIGKKPVAEITAPEVLAVLRRIEQRGAICSAHLTKSTISQVMRYAIATGRAERDPCPDLRGALKPRPRVTNHPAILEPARIGELLRAIDAYHGGHVVRAALRLMPLLFCRPGELRLMKWADVDFDAAEWRYTSTKKIKEMIVPLSRQAVEILKEIQHVTGNCAYVFTGSGSTVKSLMSDKALIYGLRALGYSKDEMSIHGFRAMARTLLAERLRIPAEYIELQLSHKVPDPLNGAYDRTRFIDDRRKMMTAWADYLDNLKIADFSKVVPFSKAV